MKKLPHFGAISRKTRIGSYLSSLEGQSSLAVGRAVLQLLTVEMRDLVTLERGHELKPQTLEGCARGRLYLTALTKRKVKHFF